MIAFGRIWLTLLLTLRVRLRVVCMSCLFGMSTRMDMKCRCFVVSSRSVRKRIRLSLRCLRMDMIPLTLLLDRCLLSRFDIELCSNFYFAYRTPVLIVRVTTGLSSI